MIEPFGVRNWTKLWNIMVKINPELHGTFGKDLSIHVESGYAHRWKSYFSEGYALGGFARLRSFLIFEFFQPLFVARKYRQLSTAGFEGGEQNTANLFGEVTRRRKRSSTFPSRAEHLWSRFFD
jgi:hypothetical protein